MHATSFHKIVLQFYVFYCLFTPHVVCSIFPTLFSVKLCNLVVDGLA
jgi:hypothetical protein